MFTVFNSLLLGIVLWVIGGGGQGSRARQIVSLIGSGFAAWGVLVFFAAFTAAFAGYVGSCLGLFDLQGEMSLYHEPIVILFGGVAHVAVFVIWPRNERISVCLEVLAFGLVTLALIPT